MCNTHKFASACLAVRNAMLAPAFALDRTAVLCGWHPVLRGAAPASLLLAEIPCGGKFLQGRQVGNTLEI